MILNAPEADIKAVQPGIVLQSKCFKPGCTALSRAVVRIPNLKKKYVEIRQISNCDPEHIDYKNTIFPMLRKKDYPGHFLKFGFFM